MSDFADKLRSARRDAVERVQSERAEREAAERQKRDRAADVDRAADMVEAHIEQRLKDYQEQFVEFRYGSFHDDGRFIRVYWNEPKTDREDEQFHQMQFRVRRYYEYDDVAVEVKMIVRNAELGLRHREEDVYEGDPRQLLEFVDQQVVRYAKAYTEQRGW